MKKTRPKTSPELIEYVQYFNNPWGYNQVLYEPITGVDSFNIFEIEESSADWNAESGVN